MLFTGSIRQNIDPFSAAQGDAPIWEALHRVGIKPAVAAMQVHLLCQKAEKPDLLLGSSPREVASAVSRAGPG